MGKLLFLAVASAAWISFYSAATAVNARRHMHAAIDACMNDESQALRSPRAAGAGHGAPSAAAAACCCPRHGGRWWKEITVAQAHGRGEKEEKAAKKRFGWLVGTSQRLE